MSWRTIAEFCYMLASAGVTYLVTWGAAWSYPQGADTIWPIGWVSIAIIAGWGVKPFLESWRRDRENRGHAVDE